jgi:DNA-binding response OmpR family regulator
MTLLTAQGRIPRVLLAEDEAEMRVLLAEALRLAGCDVFECHNGLELMQCLTGFEGSQKLLDYDLVISDIRMPYTTAMDVLRGMREYTGYPPIVLVTGFGDDETSDVARQLGAAAVLAKPFDLADLMAVVKRCLTTDSRGSYTRPAPLYDAQWSAF